MIETTKKTTMIFIDYFVHISIVRQTSLIFSNIDKLNLKLIKIFVYLSQFNLNVRYKFEKRNIVYDVLFRLLTIDNASKVLTKKKISNVFQIFFVIMLNKFKKNSLTNMLQTRRKSKSLKQYMIQIKYLKKREF